MQAAPALPDDTPAVHSDAPVSPDKPRTARTVQLPLYAGVGLVLIACLFLMRDVQSDSFWVHLGAALIAPTLFYAVGIAVMRTMNAPIAGPGIIAAGAWLLGVAVIQTGERRFLLEALSGDTFLLIAWWIAAIVITLTAHRAWSPLLFLLMPTVQVIAVWSAHLYIGYGSEWHIFTGYLMVGVWWFAAPLSARLRRTYRLWAWIFAAVLIILNGLLIPFFAWHMLLAACVGAAVIGAMLLWTRRPLIVVQAGVAALALAWALLYDIAIADIGAFGAWMGLFSGAALTVELVLRRRHARTREKPKHKGSLTTALLHMPALDAVIAVNVIALIWTAQHVSTLPPLVSALTLLIAIGGWCAAGVVYRLPVLLHVALWLLPVPVTLLLIQIAPGLWTVPLLGLAWQIMAFLYMAIGHAANRLRPPMRAPFFLAGYGLVLIGMIVTVREPALTPFSLGLTVAAYAIAGALTALSRHPAWDACAEWLIPSARMPLAHRHVRSLFIWLAGLFGAVWIQILLNLTPLSLPQQGAVLVLFSMGVLLIGRIIGRIPGVAAGAVYGAGGLMWTIGLLLVLYTPAEAVLALLIGLSFSTEALHHTRGRVWLVAIVGNLALTGWQIVRLLPGGTRAFNPWVLVLAVGVALVGAALIAETRGNAAARAVESVRAYWRTLQ